MEKQRTARTLGHVECACPDSTCLDGKNCVHQVRLPAFVYCKTDDKTNTMNSIVIDLNQL